jgi:hypothetical protein
VVGVAARMIAGAHFHERSQAQQIWIWQFAGYIL